MASIRFVHIENNLPDPFQDTPLLHLLLRGIKCSVGLSSKCCLPITMSLLWKLKTELAQAPDILPCDKLMLWSAFTLAFFAFLHSSEFTLPSTSHFNALSHLSGNDISFNSDGSLSLHLKSSKTDPYRQGCSLLIASSGHSVCAVRVIKYTWLIIPSIQMAPSILSSLASTSPEPKSPQHFVVFSNTYTFQQNSMPPTAFKSGQLQQQPRLAYLRGSFRLLVDGPAIALLFTSGLPRLFFRKYQAC